MASTMELLLYGAIRKDCGNGHRFFSALKVATPNQLRQARNILLARKWLAYRNMRIAEINNMLAQDNAHPAPAQGEQE